jgi:FAD/FMN-containing dehydrogenase/Fe-S oxidoreductase
MQAQPQLVSIHAGSALAFRQAAELEHELKRLVQGEVRFDDGSRALYSTDASNYRQIPIGLVIPRDAGDVIATVELCRKHSVPVLPRGAGTSLAGQCCNVAVVLDFTKYMNRILEIDTEAKLARVQPGVVLDSLRNQAEIHQLTFAPDPSTHNRCTIGGMIGNNSCGTHSLLGGKTVDNVEALRVLLYDGAELTVGATSDRELSALLGSKDRAGSIYRDLKSIRDRYSTLIRARFPKIPRRVSGYNLDELLPESGFHVARSLVGTEGTCAMVLEATLRLIHSPQSRCLVGLGYESTFAAADAVPEILPFAPIALEGLEGTMVQALARQGAPNVDLLPEGNGFLLVEFGTDDAGESAAMAQRLVNRLQASTGAPNARIYSRDEAVKVWRVREAGPRAAAFTPGAPLQWEGWDDAAVAPEKLGSYLREIRTLMEEYGYFGSFYGHFGHGCVHTRTTFDLQTENGIRRYREFIDRAADLVVSYGGSLSGEHGDGQSRGALLPKMFGPELIHAFEEFKFAWDPVNGLNPHKLVHPYSPIENLRLGPDYGSNEIETTFRYPEDNGSFARVALRCIGAGACRKLDSATMCPSYMVTLEEEHSTRGRAHLLFEMIKGDLVNQGWLDQSVRRSLDLCLGCKACKSECPAKVDMATYKAEFMSHYYENTRRPLQHYVFGLIDRWARLGSRVPRLSNFLVNAPGIREFVGSILAIAPQRKIPALAAGTFQKWARHNSIPAPAEVSSVHASKETMTRNVVLWPDTFNNYFHPEVGRAAVELLTDAGFRVAVPHQHVCCGRALYDFGFLPRARKYLEKVMADLAECIEVGIPIVVLEPSCASVFRDELPNLFSTNRTALRLKNLVFLLSEFLQGHAPEYKPPVLQRKVLLHGHCHQKALLGMAHEEGMLRRMGAEVIAPDSGCCGMAGPFGFERNKFEVSQRVAERVLLPAVRAASPETLIVSDGFSCREQINQATHRRVFHMAEIIKLAKESCNGN